MVVRYLQVFGALVVSLFIVVHICRIGFLVVLTWMMVGFQWPV